MRGPCTKEVEETRPLTSFRERDGNKTKSDTATDKQKQKRKVKSAGEMKSGMRERWSVFLQGRRTEGTKRKRRTHGREGGGGSTNDLEPGGGSNSRQST